MNRRSEKAEVVRVEGSRLEIEVSLPELPSSVEISLSEYPQASDEECSFLCRFGELRSADFKLEIDFSAPGSPSMAVITGEGEVAELYSYRLGSEFRLSPSMAVIVRAGSRETRFKLLLADDNLLKRYYQDEAHQEKYVSEHPFFGSFHRARLKMLSRMIERHVRRGDRVLDVGSGYSMFFLLNRDLPFRVTCCDIDIAAIEKMKGLAPSLEWVHADAASLPWDDDYFDALHAGEIIEHMPDAEASLLEWNRVLKPGGVLILSTPNRRRLLARAKKEDVPVHYEHLREFSLKELCLLLEKTGFAVLEKKGIYLEFLINWWRPPQQRVDLLTGRFSSGDHACLYSLLMRLGEFVPSVAFDLVLAARKVGDSPQAGRYNLDESAGDTSAPC